MHSSWFCNRMRQRASLNGDRSAERHIQRCPACREAMAIHQEMDARLRHAPDLLPAAAPSADLWARVSQGIEEHDPANNPAAGLLSGRRYLVPAAAVAAGSLALGLFFGGPGNQQQSVDQTVVMRNSQTASTVAEAPDSPAAAVPGSPSVDSATQEEGQEEGFETVAGLQAPAGATVPPAPGTAPVKRMPAAGYGSSAPARPKAVSPRHLKAKLPASDAATPSGIERKRASQGKGPQKQNFRRSASSSSERTPAREKPVGDQVAAAPPPLTEVEALLQNSAKANGPATLEPSTLTSGAQAEELSPFKPESLEPQPAAPPSAAPPAAPGLPMSKQGRERTSALRDSGDADSTATSRNERQNSAAFEDNALQSKASKPAQPEGVRAPEKRSDATGHNIRENLLPALTPETASSNIRANRHYRRGLDYLKRGRREQALLAFRQALRHDPGFAAAKRAVERLETPVKATEPPSAKGR